MCAHTHGHEYEFPSILSDAQKAVRESQVNLAKMFSYCDRQNVAVSPLVYAFEKYIVLGLGDNSI